MKNHQIVISGAGYVGLLTSLSLISKGFDCILIESQSLENVLKDDVVRAFFVRLQTSYKDSSNVIYLTLIAIIFYF